MFHSSVFFLSFTFLLLGSIPVLIANPDLPDPEPISVQSQSQALSTPSTIPAFPEQSNIAACPLDLTEELFRGIKSACGSNPLHRTRCCPVLAAWLYSAYSTTALQRATSKIPQTTTFDMPVLPDDSETCVDSLEKALGNKGIELVKPNQTCDLVYCYCGIRLHPLSCPEAFSMNSHGQLVGHETVNRLETDCFSSSANGYSSLAGCSKCLNSLYLLSKSEASSRSKSDERGSKMRTRDCQLMGLTWLLNKNRAGYIHTVSAVLRALMMSTNGSDPLSCTLNSDGMPLAVDSSEFYDQSSSFTLQISHYTYIVPLLLLYCSVTIQFSIY
ncbi:uncharacterized GPI-anchored protein At4g28100-like [Ipomoea triloba]|uniref:uncharacterized GPI-anchored protein At4g28100-like n=1 Tax=Ipomoea triloba TaxID=35885 RepID=UPI00125CDE3A|nr:uncharacterized GPI-anchored protein At4g28100-like [Ipomoea triloba]